MLNTFLSIVGFAWRMLLAVLLIASYRAGFHATAFFAAVAYLILALTGWVDLWPGLALWRRHGPAPQHLRGAAMATAKEVRQRVRQAGHAWTIALGGVPLPAAFEPQHLLIAGAPGSGKSVAITTALDALRARGDRVVVADSGGIYTARYFRQGDVILNPLDARAVVWSPLAEMASSWDAERLARSIVPDATGELAEWRRHAQDLLRVILEHVWSQDGSNADILRFACNATMDELRETLAGTTAEPLCASGNEKMFGSIRSTLTTQVGPFRYLPADAGRNAFSLRRWVASGSGWALWNYRDDQLDLIRPLLAAMLDTIAVGILSLPPSDERRIWLALDELASLGRIGCLESFLTKARKSGGCAIVGLQSLAQLKTLYGVFETQTLLTCFASWLMLRTPDPETADYLSKVLGDREIRRIVGSGGVSDTGTHDGWQEHVAPSRVVLASELQNLPTLCGYLALPGDIPIAPIKLALPERGMPIAQAFVPRTLDRPSGVRKMPPPPAEPRSPDEGFAL